MLSWPVFWVAVVVAFALGGAFGVMILSLCVVAGDADRQFLGNCGAVGYESLTM